MTPLDQIDHHSLHVTICWDLRLEKLSRVLITKITLEDVESKHLTKLKHQNRMILSSILDDPILYSIE